MYSKGKQGTLPGSLRVSSTKKKEATAPNTLYPGKSTILPAGNTKEKYEYTQPYCNGASRSVVSSRYIVTTRNQHQPLHNQTRKWPWLNFSTVSLIISDPSPHVLYFKLFFFRPKGRFLNEMKSPLELKE